MRKLKYKDVTKKQVDAARRFADEAGISVSQAVKYLEFIFAYKRGEMSSSEFELETGYSATLFEQFET